MANIELPFQYTPRDYQLPLFIAYENGLKRFITVWHRKAGKDISAWNFLILRAAELPGTYWSVFPTYTQGVKTIWSGFSKASEYNERGEPVAGMHFLDHIPKQLERKRNNQERSIELKNGSIIQIVGSDNLQSIVGPNPVGVVFSEYSLQRPEVWSQVVSPILEANGGWALFNSTPRGQNHLFDLWEHAQRQPERWFTDIKTIDDTRKEDGSPVVSRAQIDNLLAEGQDPDLIQQEYYCSFTGSYSGSYYSKIISELRQSNHIREIPYDPALPVFTVWDCGIADANAIWFAQAHEREVHLIDYMESTGQGMPYYIRAVKNKPYVYSNHYGPFDLEAREYGTGATRRETAQTLGVYFQIVPKLSLDDGHDAVRRLLPRSYFDRAKCDKGLRALENYAREQKRDGSIADRPKHDKWSHGADAFRYLSIIADRETGFSLQPSPVIQDFDLFS